ncbi:hypothetical protein H4R33_003754 [Dimargaris cristalligena]|nr:hypothetical protein H4R33_003754 [Dimargaris cristalligena]
MYCLPPPPTCPYLLTQVPELSVEADTFINQASWNRVSAQLFQYAPLEMYDTILFQLRLNMNQPRDPTPTYSKHRIDYTGRFETYQELLQSGYPVNSDDKPPRHNDRQSLDLRALSMADFTTQFPMVARADRNTLLDLFELLCQAVVSNTHPPLPATKPKLKWAKKPQFDLSQIPTDWVSPTRVLLTVGNRIISTTLWYWYARADEVVEQRHDPNLASWRRPDYKANLMNDLVGFIADATKILTTKVNRYEVLPGPRGILDEYLQTYRRLLVYLAFTTTTGPDVSLIAAVVKNSQLAPVMVELPPANNNNGGRIPVYTDCASQFASMGIENFNQVLAQFPGASQELCMAKGTSGLGEAFDNFYLNLNGHRLFQLVPTYVLQPAGVPSARFAELELSIWAWAAYIHDVGQHIAGIDDICRRIQGYRQKRVPKDITLEVKEEGEEYPEAEDPGVRFRIFNLRGL